LLPVVLLNSLLTPGCLPSARGNLGEIEVGDFELEEIEMEGVRSRAPARRRIRPSTTTRHWFIPVAISSSWRRRIRAAIWFMRITETRNGVIREL
jgi:hypothetical protein